MSFFLVATAEFAGHAIGDVITEAEAIGHAITEHAGKYVRVITATAPAAPAIDAPKEG